MSADLVSVVVAAHDEEAFIAEALRSVLAQTHGAIELIVVDDGSTDATAALAAELGARVIRQPRRGQSAARNAGLAVANGAFWASFDADDVMPPDRLRRQVEHLESHPQDDAVVGLAEAFVSPGERRPAHYNPVWSDGPYAGHPGTMLARRRVLEVVGGYDERLRLGEDVDWLARAHEAGVRVGSVAEVCLRYRVHRGNTSSDTGANRRATLAALRASVHRRRGGTADA
jgi:glycosyltransferase involved in cell wall biosynthesis